MYNNNPTKDDEDEVSLTESARLGYQKLVPDRISALSPWALIAVFKNQGGASFT